MRSSLLFGLILLGAGVALIVWGISASDSLSSETSKLFQGAPSNKAIMLMVVGAIIGGFGLVKLVRSPAA